MLAGPISIAASRLFILPLHYASSFYNTCVGKSFYGAYADGNNTASIFIPDAPCLEYITGNSHHELLMPVPDTYSVHLPAGPGKSLVWLTEQAIDNNLRTQSFRGELDKLLQQLSNYFGTSPLPAHGLDVHYQDHFTSSGDPGVDILYMSEHAALLHVCHDIGLHVLDRVIPPYWRLFIVPSLPMVYHIVPDDAVDHIKQLLATLKYNSEIANIVDSISIPQMRNDIRFLTGEDKGSKIVSRHSFAHGSRIAAAWLKNRFEETGARCEMRTFLTGFAPNVICRYDGRASTGGTVLLSAHYDSRGSFGSVRAPGGDDDGSGTISILSIARTIKHKRIKFDTNVELVAFAGEEQGLLGSRAYAKELRATNANLTLVIQADMLAYRAPGEPPQLGLPDQIGTPEVAQIVSNVSAIYSPELTVGFTPACCSDHQSFHEQGYPATQVFERAGPIADPMYHNSGDLSDREGYDFDQLKSIAKVQFATLLHVAGYSIEG